MNTKLLSAFFLCIFLAACGGGDDVDADVTAEMAAELSAQTECASTSLSFVVHATYPSGTVVVYTFPAGYSKMRAMIEVQRANPSAKVTLPPQPCPATS